MLNDRALDLFEDDLDDDLAETGNRCVGAASAFHDQRVYNGI